MTPAGAWGSPRRLAWAAAMALLLPQSASARPGQYLCDAGALAIKVDFTPRKAQLHLHDRQQTLARIKSARDAHYVNRKAGLTIVAKRGDLTLVEGGREHRCKLQIAA